MLHILFDHLLARLQHQRLPTWARRPDPFLPRLLRPSYRWWVRW
ncbi:MAG TPA: hypothetical protein VJG32_14015 [Anaerolineae bacterium]|nr:hypothetical protein [Anaerolineae bacterium]